jgi:Family of unknown function (DUF6011)
LFETSREVRTPKQLLEFVLRQLNYGDSITELDTEYISNELKSSLTHVIKVCPPSLAHKVAGRAQSAIDQSLHQIGFRLDQPGAFSRLKDMLYQDSISFKKFYLSDEPFSQALIPQMQTSFINTMVENGVDGVRNLNSPQLLKDLMHRVEVQSEVFSVAELEDFSQKNRISLRNPILKKSALSYGQKNFSDAALLEYLYDLAKFPINQRTLIVEIMDRDYAVNEIFPENLTQRLVDIRSSKLFKYPPDLISVPIFEGDKIPKAALETSNRQKAATASSGIPQEAEVTSQIISPLVIEEDLTLYGEITRDANNLIEIEWLTRKPGSNSEENDSAKFRYLEQHIFEELNGLADENGLTIVFRRSNRVSGITIDHGIWFMIKPSEMPLIESLGLVDFLEGGEEKDSKYLVLDFDNRLDAYRSYVEKLFQLEGLDAFNNFRTEHWRSQYSAKQDNRITVSRGGRIRISSCEECGQPLSDSTSVYYGYGPTCWRRLNPLQRRNAQEQYQRLVRKFKLQRGANTARLQIADTVKPTHAWK